MRRHLLCALFGLVLRSGAAAQPGIGVFFDHEGTQTEKAIAGFAVEFVYVLARDLDAVDRIEFGIAMSDPSWHILERNIHVAGASEFAVGDDQWLLELAGCLSAPQQVLVEYRIGYFVSPIAPSDVLFCVWGSEADVGGQGGSPGYRSCDAAWSSFVALNQGGASYPNGCCVINPTLPAPCPLTRMTILAPEASAPPADELLYTIDWSEEEFLPKRTTCIPFLFGSFSVRVQWDPAVAELIELLPPGDGVGVEISWSGISGDIVVVGNPIEGSYWWNASSLFSLRLQLAEQPGSTAVTLSELSAGDHDGGSPPAELLAQDGLISVGGVSVTSQSFGAVKARY